MVRIRILWGTGTAGTEVGSYDAALAAANVHNYNLVPVSSVLPPDATIELAGRAPDLGDPGDRLWVVEARATTVGNGPVSAGLGWIESSDGPGIVYEAAGSTDESSIASRLRDGLSTARSLRELPFDDARSKIVETTATQDSYTTVVVLAVYGRSEPMCPAEGME